MPKVTEKQENNQYDVKNTVPLFLSLDLNTSSFVGAILLLITLKQQQASNTHKDCIHTSSVSGIINNSYGNIKTYKLNCKSPRYKLNSHVS